MKKRLLLILLIILLALIGCESDENIGWTIVKETYTVQDTLEHVNNKECKVILIYGQSNAVGCTYSYMLEQTDPTLCAKYDEGFSNVKINYVIEGNSGLTDNRFLTLSLNTTNTAITFGPEMGIAEKYNEAYPDEDIFIIKYAWGGSSLNNEWLTLKGNRNIMYQNAIDFTKESLDYLKSIGYKINIEGICWMQGEADSFSGLCERYYDNLEKLVGYFRKDLRSYQKNIKFIDAYIEDIYAWPLYEEINSQKLAFSETNEYNFVIDTISLGLTTTAEPTGNPDIYHYDSLSMVTLGREFANMMINNP